MEEQLWYGKYRPLSLLSSSNGTEVFLVMHVGLGEKRILKRTEKGTRAEARLRREVYILGRAASLSVPRVFDFEESATECTIIEEYLEGETLKQYSEGKRVLELKTILELILSLCGILQGLQNCMEGFVHCDLHPANLIIQSERLSLIDFGAALTGELTGVESFYGTKGFCAPEQESGAAIDQRTDVFAVGMLISYLLGFTAGTLSVSDRRLKKRLDSVAAKATDSNPARRYQTVSLLAEALLGGRAPARRTAYELPRYGSVCTVGIAGTHSGVGVTHTALSLAWYLSNVHNKKVAVIDLSQSKALECFDSSKKGSTPCPVAGFYVFPAADSLLVGAVQNRDYDYCILDLGCAKNRRVQELLRCDKKILMTDSAPWRNNRKGIVEGFLAQKSQRDGWWLVFNLPGRSRPKDCDSLPIRILEKQYSQDLYDTALQNEELYGKIMSAN